MEPESLTSHMNVLTSGLEVIKGRDGGGAGWRGVREEEKHKHSHRLWMFCADLGMPGAYLLYWAQEAIFESSWGLGMNEVPRHLVPSGLR